MKLMLNELLALLAKSMLNELLDVLAELRLNELFDVWMELRCMNWMIVELVNRFMNWLARWMNCKIEWMQINGRKDCWQNKCMSIWMTDEWENSWKDKKWTNR